MAIGRISGPLLKANLLRDGVNLAFENDLLFLDVVNGRIGIKTASPTHDLTVNGTTRTTNLEVTTQADIATFNIQGNTISSTDVTINLEPSGVNPVVYQGKLQTGDLQLSTNVIETLGTDTDLEIRTTGTGNVNINANVEVFGDLHATGTITADGDINIGDSDTDNITFNADIKSNIVPDQTDTYDLGTDPATGGKEWRTAYIKDVVADSVTANNITAGGIDLLLEPGNTYFVSINGSDGNSGTHPNDTFLTVKFALAQASSGDTVYINAGTYQEQFPLTVPAGVTVKGAGIRSVKIVPTVATNNKDAFVLNGETTIEDLTIADFFFDGVNNTGYAFKFATGLTVTSRSPYIRNITVITKGSVTNAGDPYGFDSNDAGKGAYIDGSVANSASKEASMLFHSVTFITPNQETIVATNGVRIEWLNSFTYFADKGIYAYSSSQGFANSGLTRLRIDNQTGTFAVGDTLSYYDTDGSTVLASGTIASKDGNYINLTGRQLGFQTITDRPGKTIYAQGDAKLSNLQSKFGSTSLALDGTGDWVYTATQPDFKFGTSDFTIEGWFYRSVTGVAVSLFDFRTALSQSAPWLYITAAGSLIYNVNNTTRTSGVSGVTAGAWHHVALSRSGTDTRMFVDGVQVGLSWTDTTDYNQAPVRIGARYTGDLNFNGYIDEVRITKGVARYTGTFTPATQNFSGDLDTVLLLHFNGTNNSTTFLDDGITLQDLRTTSGGTAELIDFADYSDFGAEIRSIGSANIYGNYGTYGDGQGVVVYLISQNYAYIGSGKKSTNDPNDRIQANEVVELNGAQVYYTSVDNEGNFRVGDSFYVNQKTGDVLFDGQSLSVTSLSGITFSDGTNTTTITPTNIDTGNLRISGNTIESLTGDVNVTAASGSINLQNNTFVTGNLDVTGDVTIGGNIQIGDQSSDNINFVGSINSNLVPSTNNTYDLGTSSLRWANVYVNKAEVDGLIIDNNSIVTSGNDNLTLDAAGTGKVLISTSDVEITQDLTVTGTTTLNDVNVNGTITHIGDVNQTGTYTQTGNTEITGNLTVGSYAQFENIKIDANTIATTLPGTDLELKAATTGKIYVPSNDVLFDQDLTVNGTATIGDLNVTTSITANSFITGDILIDDNYITTTLTNSNLDLKANGTGIISIPTNDVEITQDLDIGGDLTVTTGTTYLKDTSVTGDITQTGDINQTGNFTTSGFTQVTGNITGTGYLGLSDIKISGNLVEVTTTNTDLQLQGNGTGDVVFEDIRVTNNVFASTQANQDIVLRPQGSGSVVVDTNQSLIIPVGTTAERPTSPVNGMIRYNTTLSRYEGYNATYNEWIQLSGVIDLDGNTKIIAESAPGANENILYFYADGVLTATIDSTKLFAEKFQTTGIDIEDNNITAINTNADINISTTGTGGVKIDNIRIRSNSITNVVSGAITEFAQAGTGYVKIQGTNGVVIPSGDLSQLPTVPETGMVRFNTFYNYVEVWNGTQWINSAGTSVGVTLSQAQDIGIVSALLFG